MSFDPLSSLAEDLLSYVDLARRRRQRLPRVSLYFDFESGDYRIVVRVEAIEVVCVTGASLEHAARKARAGFEAWSNDQELSIANALEISGREARADRAAGLER